jgi:hypothetical protein
MDYEMDYELIEENDQWDDCDPQAPIVQALIAVLERAKQQQQWKGPSWNDGQQVRPLLD